MRYVRETIPELTGLNYPPPIIYRKYTSLHPLNLYTSRKFTNTREVMVPLGYGTVILPRPSGPKKKQPPLRVTEGDNRHILNPS